MAETIEGTNKDCISVYIDTDIIPIRIRNLVVENMLDFLELGRVNAALLFLCEEEIIRLWQRRLLSLSQDKKVSISGGS